MQDIGRKLLQSVGLPSPDDASVAEAIGSYHRPEHAKIYGRQVQVGVHKEAATSNMIEAATNANDAFIEQRGAHCPGN